MRTIMITLLALSLTGPALATNNNNNGGCRGNCGDNGGGPTTVNNSNSNRAYGGSAYSRAGASATGVGIGVGGKGGSASVRNNNRNAQSQYQGNVGINGQSLSGVGSGNSTSVSVAGDSVTYEAAPVAPSMAPGNPTAPCLATFSGSAGTAVISLGASGFVRDSVCTWGEVARVARESGNPELANKALILMFEEAERETGTVASLMGPAATDKQYIQGGDNDDFSFQRNYD